MPNLEKLRARSHHRLVHLGSPRCFITGASSGRAFSWGPTGWPLERRISSCLLVLFSSMRAYFIANGFSLERAGPAAAWRTSAPRLNASSAFRLLITHRFSFLAIARSRAAFLSIPSVFNGVTARVGGGHPGALTCLAGCAIMSSPLYGCIESRLFGQAAREGAPP